MPFPVQVSLEKTELDQQLLAIKDLIETGKRESLRRIGKFLFARVRRDIKTKSQGGKGEDGNTWRELSKNRRKRKRREGLSDLIGVATGLTLSERFVKLSIFSDSVVVSAGGPKRFLFDNQRPIVSKNWFKNARGPCTKIIQEQLDELTPTVIPPKKRQSRPKKRFY